MSVRRCVGHGTGSYISCIAAGLAGPPYPNLLDLDHDLILARRLRQCFRRSLDGLEQIGAFEQLALLRSERAFV
jgi:hypothetical protein